MRWFILAPGPSMSRELAERVRGLNVGVVGNCYELAPWAQFLAANDRKWWDTHPEAKQFAGRRFSTKTISRIERHVGRTVKGDSNSGTLAMDVATVVFKATELVLLGFDFSGTHFFGRYTNGCSNTTPNSRLRHVRQMEDWRRAHPAVRVVNCTPGSALKVFPMGDLDEELAPMCAEAA